MASTSASTSTTSSPHSFSIVGRNLKLNSAQDIRPILDELEKVQPLEEVHFGGNTLGVEACQALADVLKTKKELKVADFADIFTGRLISEIPLALKALCDSLISHTSLVELNLSDNAFGGRSAEPMVDFLSTNRHFQVLRLNNNGLGIQGGSIVASALIKLADRLKEAGEESQLRTVICGRNRLENGSAPVWAEAFKKHGGLKEVRMFQNGIRMEGIEVLSQGLSHCKSLEILDFQDNTATVRGSRAIAKALPSWPSLTTLNLSDTLLKPRGGAMIFEQLAKGSNTKLETLQLQYNDLDRKALSTLASAIGRHLSSLAKLEINGNWADEEDDCIEAIKKALESHDHEEGLDELDEMDPEGEEDSDAEEDEQDEEDEAEVSQATAAVVVGGASGASATTAASEVPSKEPMAVPSSSATSVATKDKTASVTDSLVSSAHGEDKKIAEVAADVSRSAQAVPEKKEQIDSTADVGASAQAVYEQDEKDKHGDSALDDLTKQLAGAGIGSSQ